MTNNKQKSPLSDGTDRSELSNYCNSHFRRLALRHFAANGEQPAILIRAVRSTYAATQPDPATNRLTSYMYSMLATLNYVARDSAP